LIGPTSIVLEHWALPPLKAPRWTSNCKVETKHESWTLGKPYGINLRCYWEHIGNLGGEPFENLTNCGTKWKLHFPLFILQLPQNINNVNEIIFILGYPCSHCFHYTTSFTFLISFFHKTIKRRTQNFFLYIHERRQRGNQLATCVSNKHMNAMW
jgi:hypothetical protein